jgi:hypothetical protein
MSELILLAERVEKASGPDRELDARIWCIADETGRRVFAAHPLPEKAVSFYYGCSGFKDGKPVYGFSQYRGPKYTASLDAAMTLVPDGHYFTVERSQFGVAACVDSPKPAKPRRPNPLEIRLETLTPNVPDGSSQAATPALALIAAALRARASLSEQDGEKRNV